MPVMDGLTASRLIRKFEQKEGLPATEIIALTGHSSVNTQKDAFASGIDKFLTKPVRLKELNQLLLTKEDAVITQDK
jgi:CheY-like chemotaxis protein